MLKGLTLQNMEKKLEIPREIGNDGPEGREMVKEERRLTWLVGVEVICREDGRDGRGEGAVELG